MFIWYEMLFWTGTHQSVSVSLFHFQMAYLLSAWNKQTKMFDFKVSAFSFVSVWHEVWWLRLCKWRSDGKEHLMLWQTVSGRMYQNQLTTSLLCLQKFPYAKRGVCWEMWPWSVWGTENYCTFMIFGCNVLKCERWLSNCTIVSLLEHSLIVRKQKSQSPASAQLHVWAVGISKIWGVSIKAG